MIELGFILALEISGLALALALARVAAGPDPGQALRRIVSAVERAASALVARQRWFLATSALALSGLVCLFHVTFGRLSPLGFLLVGILLGSGLATLLSHAAAVATTRAAGATAAAARSRLNVALTSALRAAGAVGIGAEAASTLGALGLLALGYFSQATGDASVETHPLAARTLALPGYALGAALAALVLQRAGGVYQVAAEAGRSRAELGGARLAADDPKNPALVSDLVAGAVGPSAAGAAAVFAASALGTALVLLLATRLAVNPAEQARFAVLPLVIRSFGLVGCAAGILSARSEEAHGHGQSLVRGLASAATITLFGILGGAYWLVPEHSLVLAAAGVCGLFSAGLGPAAIALMVARSSRPLRETAETLERDPASAFGSSLGYGLSRASVPLVGAIATALGAMSLGASTELPGGGLLGLAVWAMAFLALVPYALGVVAFGAIVKGARGMAALGGLDAPSRLRLQRLDDVGAPAGVTARPLLAGASALTALAAALAVLGPDPGTRPPLLAGCLCGTLGAALILAHTGRSARAAARAARALGLEVDRQLGGPPGEHGTPIVPASYAPNYRACEDMAARATLARIAPELGALLVMPVLLGSGLGLVYRFGSSRLAAAALATFVATAAVTALGAALAVDGARAVQNGARQLNRPERDTAGSSASIAGDVLANILGTAAGPAACLQALLAASFALSLVGLLF